MVTTNRIDSGREKKGGKVLKKERPYTLHALSYYCVARNVLAHSRVACMYTMKSTRLYRQYVLTFFVVCYWYMLHFLFSHIHIMHTHTCDVT